MRLRSLLLLPLLLIVAAGPAPARPAATPVVIELFTSQGCSSCPSADRLLSEIGSDRLLTGRVIPLAFHVDYWNRLGWADPFSSSAWSRRQGRYASRGQVYTPQAVLNGTTEMVGSDEREMRRQIDRLSSVAPKAQVTLTLAVSGKDSIEGRYDIATDASLPAERVDLMVAVAESGLVTAVPRGENGGRSLRNDFIVRSLTAGGSVKRGERRSGSITLKLDPAWKRKDLQVVAFVQDPLGLGIWGAAERTVAP